MSEHRYPIVSTRRDSASAHYRIGERGTRPSNPAPDGQALRFALVHAKRTLPAVPPVGTVVGTLTVDDDGQLLDVEVDHE